MKCSPGPPERPCQRLTSSLPFPCLPRRAIQSCGYATHSLPAPPHAGAGPRMLRAGGTHDASSPMPTVGKQWEH